ncbi:enoyl-[acyl-carrier protein] reductase FabI [Gottschalkia acidurici 9a]|uniref:Probable nitronate monooxygenase n=1 Tax=Gottschalkia acidurici (strain ATCC 7906 / DSM 604 / BCRC 14475 / CIP 104303 / KCTC 5404 / NCIMB 10678 / 9a) TaxID=1128398 RepID=K0B0P1_GOTA9|nr:enoyl-[acyl-carrier-protein] reductase FabK [Gottschalkia acidurici]AFS78642.1 enoyl-[acyl-carrier protein] reductase FabI [Gottschalkia acidurici 9a]
MFRTEICDILNIKYPIIQGGMAWAATAELAGAVSNAGGLGIIGCGHAPASVIKEEIKKVRQITDKPYGVNVMLLSPHVEEVIELLLEEKVPVITTGAGNPGKYIDKFKEIGTKVIPVVPTVALAKRMEKVGADAIIVEGTEAGGHIGELTTMTLLPQIVDAVKIPVIAAGGIADGRGLIAALALGAKGVQIGTRFVCTNECVAHDNFKQVILKAGDRDAIVTGRSTGHPVRAIKNKFTKRFLDLEKGNLDLEELTEFGAGALRKAVIEGDIDNGTIMAGQISGLIKDIKSCEEVVSDIISEAIEIRNTLINI